MINIITDWPRVIKKRDTLLKKFDIDVTIKEETHYLNISIKSEEDKQGQDSELINIAIDIYNFSITEDEDLGEVLHGHLGRWFDDKYPKCPTKDSEEDFDNIFSAVWEYIEKKNLY